MSARRQMLWRLVALLTWLPVVGCGGPRTPDGGPDAVVLIVIDTLRADHLGCYGYPGEISPGLDGLATRGVRFDDVTSTAPVTLPAVTSILTGLNPPGHGVRDNAGFVLDEGHETLAERFEAAGWRTGAVVASAVLSSDRGLDAGFEVYRDDFGGDYPVYDASLAPLKERLASDRRRADRTTDLALETAARFGKDPFFLLVHYFDVHDYYDPPPEHRARFPSSAYAGEVHFVDREIDRLLDGIGTGHEPLVVVVADHGEGLGDHGESGHGFLLHQATIRVPLIVAGPGIEPGRVREDPVSLVDLERSIAASVGLAPAASPRDGRILDWNGPADPDPPAHYSETMRTLFSYGWSHLRALRDGPFKLVEGPYDELFDLSVDPGELAPLEATHPRAAGMKSMLREIAGDDDPEALLARAADPDPDRVETLASLGYAGGGATPGSGGREYWRPHPATRLEDWNRRQRNRPHYRRAMVHLERGEYELAVTALDSFLRTEPRHADALYNRGRALKLLGRDGEAMESLRATLRADPDHVPGLRTYTRELLQREEFRAALGYLQDLAQLEDEDPNAHYNLGVCALRLSETELARRSLATFLRLAPDDGRARSVRRTLDQLD